MLNLVGNKSIEAVIGAVFSLSTAEGLQTATVSTAGSYLSSSDKRVHFGLGRKKVVEKIEIRWPSGIRQTLKDVLADQILRVDEPVSSAAAANIHERASH